MFDFLQFVWNYGGPTTPLLAWNSIVVFGWAFEVLLARWQQRGIDQAAVLDARLEHASGQLQLLGLLGTVLGLCMMFGVMDQPAQMLAAISQAVGSTVWGTAASFAAQATRAQLRRLEAAP